MQQTNALRDYYRKAPEGPYQYRLNWEIGIAASKLKLHTDCSNAQQRSHKLVEDSDIYLGYKMASAAAAASAAQSWRNRDDHKKQKELEEARKAGTAMPETDEDGNFETNLSLDNGGKLYYGQLRGLYRKY